MPTFRKKNAVVDARQFTGGIRNGMDLVLWVTSNQGWAAWREKTDRLDLTIWGRTSTVWVNDWVILNTDGTFDQMHPEDFKEEYEQV